jgi:hypothetical protein
MRLSATFFMRRKSLRMSEPSPVCPGPKKESGDASPTRREEDESTGMAQTRIQLVAIRRLVNYVKG